MVVSQRKGKMLTITRGYLVLVQSSSISPSILGTDESYNRAMGVEGGKAEGEPCKVPHFLEKLTWREEPTGPGLPQHPTRTEDLVPLVSPPAWALQWVLPVVSPRPRSALSAAGSALFLPLRSCRSFLPRRPCHRLRIRFPCRRVVLNCRPLRRCNRHPHRSRR